MEGDRKQRFRLVPRRNDLSIALVDPEDRQLPGRIASRPRQRKPRRRVVVSYLLGLADIRQLARVNVSVTPPVALRAVGG